MTSEVNKYLEQTIMNILPQQANANQPIHFEANPFLLLKVSRHQLVQDTLTQLQKHSPHELRRPLIVQFEGEEGRDEGGLKKEYFDLITHSKAFLQKKKRKKKQKWKRNETKIVIADPSSGFFVEEEESKSLWFSPKSKEPEEKFQLIGTLIGMAIYNGCLIDVPFPATLYKYILGQELNLDDLREVFPTLANNLQKVCFLISLRSVSFEQDLNFLLFSFLSMRVMTWNLPSLSSFKLLWKEKMGPLLRIWNPTEERSL